MAIILNYQMLQPKKHLSLKTLDFVEQVVEL